MGNFYQQVMEEEEQKWLQALKDDEDFNEWLKMLDNKAAQSGLRNTPNIHNQQRKSK